MARTTVNREERLSQVLSVRLTEYQSRRLQNTFKNFGLKGSPSERMRLLLRKIHWRSVDYANKHREIRRLVQLKKEKEEESIKREEEEEKEEAVEHEKWFSSLGEEEVF